LCHAHPNAICDFQEADENIEPFKHYYGITEQEELAANKIL